MPLVASCPWIVAMLSKHDCNYNNNNPKGRSLIKERVAICNTIIKKHIFCNDINVTRPMANLVR